MEGIPAVIKSTISHWFSGKDESKTKTKPFTVEDIPDLSGKVVIVTGGNIGLGRASCLELARHNAHVYLTARTQAKADEAIAFIKENVPQAQITFLPLDLASFASIKQAADTFTASNTRLDILLNNAGVMALPEGLTTEGYEIQFGTNHLGHALFTKLLLPTLLRTAESPTPSDVRIITVSSEGHKLTVKGGIDLPHAKTDLRATSTWQRYGQSKLANILYTQALAQHYPALKCVAVHPGAVHTQLYFGFRDQHQFITGLLAPVLLRMLKTPEQGALTQLFAATSAEAKSGVYYTPVAKETALGGQAKDQKLVEELWEWTESEFKEKGY